MLWYQTGAHAPRTQVPVNTGRAGGVGYNMIKVTFVDPNGSRLTVEAADGDTLMEAAITHDVPGIVGHCGGMCSCGTCHCYVTDEWAARIPPKEAPELDTLTHVLDRELRSRLGCQIRLDPSLDGLVVQVPARQRVP